MKERENVVIDHKPNTLHCKYWEANPIDRNWSVGCVECIRKQQCAYEQFEAMYNK